MSSLAHLARAGVSLCVLGHVVLLVSGQTCRTLTTFNAALTPRIADYPDRRARQPDALLMEDSDVICLQEYWLEKDIDFMLKAVSSKYRYHYSPLHSSLNVLLTISKKRLIPETACDPADAAYFYFRVLPCVLLRG
ncbi:hypothetical protein EGW08_007851 [Elysia chlorotica]|uniref:Endonuclease/exonuclease/phosphatase domain-containing protein n=1 Tax=Elysia chlorotica TaxID=188477 RepID=A0A3S1BI43_ELYCH|nr:hypothetical protein EGW08_007851 [Elysia chlorotica]